MFKSDWEKTDQLLKLDQNILKEMIAQFFPRGNLISCQIISGGCANLNSKIIVDGSIYILRVYLRDKDACYREQKLAALIKSTIPIPEIYYISKIENYQFSIIEYMEGITLRDLILNHPNEDIKPVMREVGLILANIKKYQFLHAGFFGQDLKIKQKISKNEYIEFARNCLNNKIVQAVISERNIVHVNDCLNRYCNVLPEEPEHNLVHGDYDPANILVEEKEDKWKVSAILDWEFAFSGSSLVDIANMVRYAHKLPSTFTESFMLGLKEGGLILEDNWQTAVNLINLISLLELLTRSSLNQHPNRCKDLKELIEYLIQQLR
ncbi:MAG: phosphotransferase family protein [Alphaproteobacteria bacterium]